MSEKRISVIMPVYNAESYVRESVADVLAQTYQNLEIILVNDGSTDNSLAILREFAEKDNRVKIIESENEGASSARNKGLDIASGEYIRFVDADDRIPKDSIEKLIEPYREYQDIDLVIGNYICTPQNNYMTGDFVREGKMGQKEFLQAFVSYVKSFYFGVPWNKLYRREIIAENYLRFDESVFWCEDFLFNISYFRKCNQFYMLKTNEGIYEYCKRDDSITENLKNNVRIDFERIDQLRYEAMRDYCKHEGMEENFILEWNYSELFGKLSAATKKDNKKTGLVERYKKFKSLLQGEDVYKYICQKERETHLKVWKLLKFSKAREDYFVAFSFFYVKGCAAVYGKIFMPFLRAHFQAMLPKNL